MPNVAGVNTALLSKINLSTEQAWTLNQAKIETVQVNAATLDIMKSKQLPLEGTFVQKLTDPEKEYDVKVRWPDFSGLQAQDNVTDVCNDLTGTQAPVIEKQYKIESGIEDTFAIEEDKLATSEIDKATFITENQNAIIKRLLEKWSDKHVAFLAANAGHNAGVLYTHAAGVTEVPSADYNVSLLPKIMQDMIYSQIPNAFLIDGGPMHLPYVNAKLDFGNAEGKGNNARTQLFDAGFDLIGFARQTLADRSFLVAPYSYASLTKNYVLNREPVYDEAMGSKGMWKYHITIPMYGVKIDVFHQRVCVDGRTQRYKLIWHYKLNYEILANPTGFANGDGDIVTGIIQYKKITS